jgi:hypothetical protein
MLLEGRVAVRLRTRLGLQAYTISDAELINKTKGSFLQASIRLGLAVDDLWASIKRVF